MVAGRILYRNGVFTAIDYPALLAAFLEAAAGLGRRAP
jgi:hypothetical protein